MNLLEDVIVIGGGPAGLSAALNARLEGMSTLLVEKTSWGGRAAQSARIDNVLGHGGISGPEFVHRAKAHAEREGVITVRDGVERIDGHLVHLASGAAIAAKTIIVATGLEWRELEIEGLREALASGKARYGCMYDDGPAMQGKRVGVLGGANSAGINALHFAECGAQYVVMFTRGSLRGMSYYLHAQVMKHPRIRFSSGELEGIETQGEGLYTTTTHGSRDVVDALFLFPDAKPGAAFLRGAERCEKGFLVAPDFETSARGIFVAGDVRSGSTKRIATAIGEGASVIYKVKQFLEEAQRCRTCVA